ncbi:MAG: hydrolase [Pseudomonas sp.]|uniref:hydrolase n=1 Tax=Pseudomonas sp. TaxID=306 RepID=UPI003D10180B
MKIILSICFLVLLLGSGLAVFLNWAEKRPDAHYLSDLRSVIDSGPSTPQASGNLLLIRPQLAPADYQSPHHLQLKIASALDNARQAGLLGPQTLVVLPEHIGTWLLARDQKPELYQTRSRQEARDWLLLGNPLLAVKALLVNLDADRLDEALLRMKAEQMARDYQQVFSALAKEYQVTLLAGSILLPEPLLKDGQLSSGDGPLRNLSLVFAPDGSIQGEAYDEPWPWRPGARAPQQVVVGEQRYRIERDWRPGYPQSTVQALGSGITSPPLFLRGNLDWPVGGASRNIHLTPRTVPQLSDEPGSHLLNLWLTAP